MVQGTGLPAARKKCPQGQLITGSRTQFNISLIHLVTSIPQGFGFACPFSRYSFSLFLWHFPGLFYPHSSPEKRVLSPPGGPSTVRSWRSFWIWSSHFLLIGDHQEEFKIFSCNSNASYSQSPLGIIGTNLCFNSILPCTSSPTGCQEGGKNQPHHMGFLLKHSL